MFHSRVAPTRTSIDCADIPVEKMPRTEAEKGTSLSPRLEKSGQKLKTRKRRIVFSFYLDLEKFKSEIAQTPHVKD